MFDFLRRHEEEGHKIETLALFHETRSSDRLRERADQAANERGYKIVADIKYRSNTPSLSAEVSSSRWRMPTC